MSDLEQRLRQAAAPLAAADVEPVPLPVLLRRGRMVRATTAAMALVAAVALTVAVLPLDGRGTAVTVGGEPPLGAAQHERGADPGSIAAAPTYLGSDPSRFPETAGGEPISPDQLPEPVALTAGEKLRPSLTFAVPPAARSGILSAEDAFVPGVTGGPYRATTAPDRVFLAAVTDASYGEDISGPSRPSAEQTPEARARQAEARSSGSAGQGTPGGVARALDSRLAWVYYWDDRPYNHLRAGIHRSDFVVIVDARIGDYLFHVSVPASTSS